MVRFVQSVISSTSNLFGVRLKSASLARPRATSIVVGNQTLTVNFLPPEGTPPILNYKYSTNGGSTYVDRSPVNTSSPITITGLNNGTSYNVRLAAIFSGRNSEPSNALAGIPVTLPSAPLITSIETGDRVLSAYYTVVDTGGSSITNRRYSLNKGTSFTSAGAGSSPIIISNLTNGIEYDIRIQLTTAVGTSTTSNQLSGTLFAPFTFAKTNLPTLNSYWAQNNSTIVALGQNLYAVNRQTEVNNCCTWLQRTSAWTSPVSDGVNWSLITLHQGTNLLTFDPITIKNVNNNLVVLGKFGAFGSTTAISMYKVSTDGTNWVTRDFPVTSSYWHDIEYMPNVGRYVAISSSPSRVLYSADLINWTAITLTGGATIPTISFQSSKLVYGNGQMILNHSDGTSISTVDGINWSTINLPTPLNSEGLAYGNGLWVQLAAYNSGIAYVLDASGVWAPSSSLNVPLNSNWDVSYNSTIQKFVIVGGNGLYSTSSDGINWTPYSTNSNATMYSINGSSNKVFLLGGNASSYFVSTALN